MADGATIDHEALYLIFGGLRIKGRAKGQSVSAVYDEDAFQKVVGVDGEGFWIKNSDKGATITVVLLQSAAANTVLSAVHNRDRNTPGGLMLPLSIVESNGQTLLAAEAARIIKMADATWSDGAEVRTWTIGTTRLEGVVGGVNATPIDPQGAQV